MMNDGVSPAYGSGYEHSLIESMKQDDTQQYKPKLSAEQNRAFDKTLQINGTSFHVTCSSDLDQ